MRTRGNVKLMALLAAVLTLALVLPASLSGGTALALIDDSCRFIGPVTLCRQNVPPGTVITVSLDPVNGPFWTTTTFMNAGTSHFWIDIPADDPGTVDKDGGVAGDTVYFSITYEDTAFTQVMPGPDSSWKKMGHINHALRLCPYLGDANLDGVIDAGDISKVQRIIWGLDPPTPTADANNDGVVDAGDITRIRQIIWGLVDPISCCSVS